MEEAKRLLEENELMRYLILFKLYIESSGIAMKQIYNVKNSIMDLYKEDFDRDLYLESVRYLHVNKGYIDRNANSLTYKGLDHTEEWIKTLDKLPDEDIEELKQELPEPFFDFFRFTKNTTTILSFINQLLKLSDKLK